MKLVFGYDEAVKEWVEAGLGVRIAPPFTAIGGTLDDRTLCAGAVFNNWNGFNLDISVYGPGALTRDAFRAVARYVFVQVGATRLTAVTRRSNKVMRKHLPRLGFEFEGTSKRYFGDEDALRFGLLNAKKWIG